VPNVLDVRPVKLRVCVGGVHGGSWLRVGRERRDRSIVQPDVVRARRTGFETMSRRLPLSRFNVLSTDCPDTVLASIAA
jgi:hypothetical protein